MIRNLDLTALRAFVTVAETGGVTRAAGLLHVTQSAVSMQLKRLETSLDLALLDRSTRRIGLTTQGEQLLAYGQRLLALNDEVYARLTDQAFEGELVLGVPADIVYPHIPTILKHFASEYPRVKVHLISSFTNLLKRQFDAGECDVILTTENHTPSQATCLGTQPLIWVGAPDGVAWKTRPLRIAFENACLFRAGVQQALSDAGVDWEMAVNTDSTRTIEASVMADLAVHACMSGSMPQHVEPIDHSGQLPELAVFNVNLYVGNGARAALAQKLAELITHIYDVN